MRLIRHLSVVAFASLLFLVGLSIVSSPAQAANPWDCAAGDNPNNFSGTVSTPLAPARSGSRAIEFRFHAGHRCAWGRILYGAPGDLVWVDWKNSRSDPDSARVQLRVWQINDGESQFTNSYNDAGHVMRACGQAVGQPVGCTGWY
ncbi:glycosyl hydrolase [Cryptosporangium sp. NPDC048952]|uniref:glycosyl hydrolase n=1 Tax=Cryptosporangium sp. NPDC048952 TaxID=3363961 RepID=UPI00370F86C7